MATHQSRHAKRLMTDELDANADVFEGLMVQQKFSNRSLYETKFVWIKLKTRTIHLSEHATKARRHKEASLDDVISIKSGPPKKPLNRAIGEENLCLTVQFKNGGGIDIKFSTSEQRDRWAEYLSKICTLEVMGGPALQ